MSKALVVNLFGAPCAGKSTMAAGLFYRLKRAGVDAELSLEYAKEVTFDKRWDVMRDQIYLLAKQRRRIERLVDQCEVIVTDCPLLLGGIYYPDLFPESFRETVVWTFNQNRNQNYFLDRAYAYSSHGRQQTEAEADELAKELRLFLTKNNVSFQSTKGDDEGLASIYADVMRALREQGTAK